MPNPFAHIELTTDDMKASKKFYSKVFAWQLKDMPGMPYTMIDVSGGTGGGMQLRPMPDAPTGWMPYVQVDDVTKTIATAVKAGGSAVIAYRDLGGMGSLGVFADPHGSVIGVWAKKPAADVAPKTAPPKSVPKTKTAAKKPASAPSTKALAKKAPLAGKTLAKKVAAPAKKSSAKGRVPAPTKPPKKAATPKKKTPAKKR